jgi:hypothetical protein
MILYYLKFLQVNKTPEYISKCQHVKQFSHTHPQEYVPWRVEASGIDSGYSWIGAVTEDATRKPRYRALQHLVLASLVSWNRVHHHEIDGRLGRSTDLQGRTPKLPQVRDAGNSSMHWNGEVVSLRTTGELVKVHTTVCYFVWRKDSKQNMFSNTPGSLCEDSRFLNIGSRPFDKFWLHFLQAPLQLLHRIEGETPNSLLK